MAKKTDPEKQYAARNRKARHNYFIEDSLEAGIVLSGTEVKSLREGRASIEEAYASDEGGEIFLINAYIPEYKSANISQHQTHRHRKLLLHKREMGKLAAAVSREGMTLVPLSVYFNPRGIAKVELGIAKGKRQYEKRQSAKDHDWKRDKARLMRGRG
jgi:SsrA-binding protein